MGHFWRLVPGQRNRPTWARSNGTQCGLCNRSGRTMDRPGLDSLLHYVRKGRRARGRAPLDGLGRSLGELLATVGILRPRGIDLLSLEEKIDTPSAAGELVFHVFRCDRPLRAAADRGAHQGRDCGARARAANGQVVSRSIRTRSRRREDLCRQSARYTISMTSITSTLRARLSVPVSTNCKPTSPRSPSRQRPDRPYRFRAHTPVAGHSRTLKTRL